MHAAHVKQTHRSQREKHLKHNLAHPARTWGGQLHLCCHRPEVAGYRCCALEGHCPTFPPIPRSPRSPYHRHPQPGPLDRLLALRFRSLPTFGSRLAADQRSTTVCGRRQTAGVSMRWLEGCLRWKRSTRFHGEPSYLRLRVLRSEEMEEAGTQRRRWQGGGRKRLSMMCVTGIDTGASD